MLGKKSHVDMGKISCQHGIFFKMPCGKKKSHVDMGFLSKRHVGKKSHVDMRFSRAHVNMRFFSQHGVLKKSHVNMEHLFLMACICCRSPCAGDTLGNPDVCPIAPKFACPGDSGVLGKPDVCSSATLACPCDGGALGEPDVSLTPFFFGVIALITIRPLRKTCPVARASIPGCCSPSCAMRP